MTILTQQPVVIDLSRPAMRWLLIAMDECEHATVDYQTECEIDNFANLLVNLLERTEPEPGNFDLVGG